MKRLTNFRSAMSFIAGSPPCKGAAEKTSNDANGSAVGRPCHKSHSQVGPQVFEYATRARFRPSTGVLNDLYAKAMALESADGQRAVLISVDLCVFRAPLTPVPSVERLKGMAEGPVWESYNARRMLRALEKKETLPTTYSAPLAVWKFGGDLTLVALSGEVVVDYVRLLREHLRAERLRIAAYCNEVFGYLPSARILAEGGYETRGLTGDAIGFFSPEVEKLVIQRIKQLAEPEPNHK
jgi:hypothetical protein